MKLAKIMSATLLALLLTSCAHHDRQLGENLINALRRDDPAVASLLDRSVAYVVYPKVNKGAIGVGSAFAKGDVYEKGFLGYSLVGYSELTQLSAGLQLGAQSYSEIVFFEDIDAFNRFKQGNIQLSTNASGVFFPNGQNAHVSYENGCAVAILRKDGLMGELSVGGQKLSYLPL